MSSLLGQPNWDASRRKVEAMLAHLRQQWSGLSPLAAAARHAAVGLLQPLAEILEANVAAADTRADISAIMTGVNQYSSMNFAAAPLTDHQLSRHEVLGPVLLNWRHRWPAVRYTHAEGLLSTLEDRHLLLNAIKATILGKQNNPEPTASALRVPFEHELAKLQLRASDVLLQEVGSVRPAPIFENLKGGRHFQRKERWSPRE